MLPKDMVYNFIKEHLKYQATKPYIGALRGRALSNLWYEMDQFGQPHKLTIGKIDRAAARLAFLREMKLNPVRYRSRDKNAKFIAHIKDVLARFEKLWPNGTPETIRILDKWDEQYTILCDVRDIFRNIAYQNTKDLEIAEYRDEMVAYFANNRQIAMGDYMRTVLSQRAASTAQLRQHRRQIADMIRELSDVENRMAMTRVSDSVSYRELQDRHDELQAQLDALRGKKVSSPRWPKEITLEPKSDVVNDDVYDDDVADREAELLRSMTPEHSMDETFQNYAKNTIGHNGYNPFVENEY